MVLLYTGVIFMVLFILAGLYQIHKGDIMAAFIFIGGAVLLIFPTTAYYFEVINEVHISQPNCSVQHAWGEQAGMSAYASIRITTGASEERYVF